MQQMVSSAEYAKKISETTDDVLNKVDMIRYNQLNKAFDRGLVLAVQHFMHNYNVMKNNFIKTADGVSFEVLDKFFSDCAIELVGDING